jgi:hypothetical protein
LVAEAAAALMSMVVVEVLVHIELVLQQYQKDHQMQ